jgi:hypothetical protein
MEQSLGSNYVRVSGWRWTEDKVIGGKEPKDLRVQRNHTV